jgi:CDP-paratose 2-epimerase
MSIFAYYTACAMVYFSREIKDMNKTICITGGAGFIGTNASLYFQKKGYTIIVFDNFSRKGSKKNATYLQQNNIQIYEGDVTDFNAVKKIIKKADIIVHLAGQVAVTSSILNPRHDFESNLLGTFNILEAVRTGGRNQIIMYASTNKVYGNLSHESITEEKDRYTLTNLPYGISEKNPLDFHSPYGCSKGAADQYVLDYSRIYNLRTIVFRQSCIYGPHQFGIEDQGWIAWFLIALWNNKPITIYGNGKQVRDILYIDDLLDVYDLAIEKADSIKGEVFNIGGGLENSLSVWGEFKPILENIFKRNIIPQFETWRPGDQKVYISDIRKAKKLLRWKPEIKVIDGITMLHTWIKENKKLFS